MRAARLLRTVTFIFCWLAQHAGFGGQDAVDLEVEGVRRLLKDGHATIAYSNKELGEITINTFLPVHRSPAFLEKYIAKMLPRDSFFSRMLMRKDLDLSEVKLFGSFDTELGDQFYQNLLAKQIQGHRVHISPDCGS